MKSMQICFALGDRIGRIFHALYDGVGDDRAEQLLLDPARGLRRAQRHDADRAWRLAGSMSSSRRACSAARRRHPCRTGSARTARRPSTFALRRIRLPVRRRIDRRVGGAEEEIRLAADLRAGRQFPGRGCRPRSRSAGRESRSNTGLASGWSPCVRIVATQHQQVAHAERGGAQQVALQREPVAVAAGELEDRLDPVHQQDRRGGQRAHVRARAGAVGDVHGVGQARAAAAPCPAGRLGRRRPAA